MINLLGYHLWGFDLRSDDTPIEANLGFLCRKNGDYKGKNVVNSTEKQWDSQAVSLPHAEGKIACVGSRSCLSKWRNCWASETRRLGLYS